MIIGGETNKGGRKINQDAFFMSLDSKVFVIADGAGGHNAGEIASSMVVEGIAAYVKENPIADISEKCNIQAFFCELIEQINKRVFEKSTVNKEFENMATTVIMVYIEEKDETAFVFNVGDSRAYIIRNHEIIQITEDHTYVNELVKRGEVSKDDVPEHPMHHVITRAIGGKQTVKIDAHMIRYKQGDVFMLCSDGLYNEVPDDEICRIIMNCGNDMQDASEKLIEAANVKEGCDNITTICIKM